MINVAAVLEAVPNFQTFCSIDTLYALVDEIRTDSHNFLVEVVGTSTNGLPIYHVQFGKGVVKALVVAFPHCSEPVGGLTVFSLLTLLRQRNQGLIDADVEWHIVPCIDPDGALLNEGWTQKPLTLANYMRNAHRPELRDQVECSFPINHKRLKFDRPTREAEILHGLLTKIRPDFYFSLHDTAGCGGAWYLISREIHQRYFKQLHELLDQNRMPLRTSLPFSEFSSSFGAGVTEPTSIKKFYDFLEKTTPYPEQVLQSGSSSWEYLAEINHTAMTFIAEIPYFKHPSDGSKAETTQYLRQLKLQVDAENKFIAASIFEEWGKVKDDLDAKSPFYKKIFNGLVSAKETLNEGLTSWPYKTRAVLFAPEYAGMATEGERFNAHMWDRFIPLCNSYEFVRLLKASVQTPEVKGATARLEAIFEEALDDMARNVDFSNLEVIDCTTLAKVQLGSGLIALNSLLEH